MTAAVIRRLASPSGKIPTRGRDRILTRDKPLHRCASPYAHVFAHKCPRVLKAMFKGQARALVKLNCNNIFFAGKKTKEKLQIGGTKKALLGAEFAVKKKNKEREEFGGKALGGMLNLQRANTT